MKAVQELANHLLEIGKDCEMVAARFMADHYYLCMSKKDFERIKFSRSYKTFLEDMDIKVVYGVYMVDAENQMPVNVMCDRAFWAAHDKTYNYVEYIHFYNDAEHKQIMLEQEIENGMEKALKAFNKIGVPVHEIAMMMSISLRFIPILTEETDRIMKAQMLQV